jgi:uncharacterized protein YndB with AHSA1/START domain
MIEAAPLAELLFEVDLPEAPEQVWRALTIPAFVERWLLPLGAANKNGNVAFAGTAPELDRPVEVMVLDAEPFHRLRWRWQEEDAEAGLVTITLLPRADGGTSLSLVHERRLTARLMPAPANANTAMALAA